MGLIKFTLLALAFAIVGCSTPAPAIIETKIVEVPVVVPINITVPPRPVLEIDKLTATDPPGVVVRAYLITVEQLTAHTAELEALLQSIVTPNPEK